MKAPLIVLAAAAALAGTAVNAHTVTVAIGDLNLATAEGQTRLDRRIEHAARTVCAVGEPVTGTRIRDPQEQECYRLALAHAHEQTALLVEKSGRRPG